MSKPLPTHGFKWMNESELTSWKNISGISKIDLKYSKDLHDLHNDYPLTAEMIEISKVNKLITNLDNKVQYISHYENLKVHG